MSNVFFIGAGPGDPELLTIKGKKCLEEADVVIYAGSLVNRDILAWCRKECKLHDSAGLDLDAVIALIEKAHGEGGRVVRLHSGDPGLYGAIREQMDRLERLGIPYEVIPGVSSFLASCAALKKEFTLPGVSQTVICTRMEGRTPVPGPESLESLASHRASMAIFLSVHMIADVVKQLMTHYDESTPVAVIHRVTWPDEKIITGTLKNIASRVQEGGISKTALILVGGFLGDSYELSKLYDANFSHGYRSKR
jgi:precorrin-4/cobalt-precorrin-4 C11-methyltransferase